MGTLYVPAEPGWLGYDVASSPPLSAPPPLPAPAWPVPAATWPALRAPSRPFPQVGVGLPPSAFLLTPAAPAVPAAWPPSPPPSSLASPPPSRSPFDLRAATPPPDPDTLLPRPPVAPVLRALADATETADATAGSTFVQGRDLFAALYGRAEAGALADATADGVDQVLQWPWQLGPNRLTHVTLPAGPHVTTKLVVAAALLGGLMPELSTALYPRARLLIAVGDWQGARRRWQAERPGQAPRPSP